MSVFQLQFVASDIFCVMFADTTTIDNVVAHANQSGSNTHDKKNRKKRAAIWLKTNLSQGERATKRLKLEPKARAAYNKYLSKRLLKKPITERDEEDIMKEQ